MDAFAKPVDVKGGAIDALCKPVQLLLGSAEPEIVEEKPHVITTVGVGMRLGSAVRFGEINTNPEVRVVGSTVARQNVGSNLLERVRTLEMQVNKLKRKIRKQPKPFPRDPLPQELLDDPDLRSFFMAGGHKLELRAFVDKCLFDLHACAVTHGMADRECQEWVVSSQAAEFAANSQQVLVPMVNQSVPLGPSLLRSLCKLKSLRVLRELKILSSKPHDSTPAKAAIAILRFGRRRYIVQLFKQIFKVTPSDMVAQYHAGSLDESFVRVFSVLPW